MEILTGLVLGFSTLVFIGPVFFYLITSSLSHSVRAGLAVAVGVIIGDIIYVVLVMKGLSPFFQTVENKKWLAIVGSVLLIFIGLKYIFKPAIDSNTKEKPKPKSLMSFAIHGFLINFVNPFVIGVWILFFGINQSKGYSHQEIIISLSASLLVIFTTDCLKAIFARKLQKFSTPKRLKQAQKLLGIIMIFFAIRLLFSFL